MQELILSAFGAAGKVDEIFFVLKNKFFCSSASACQEQLAPYFPRLIAVLKGFIRMQYSQEHSILQSQAVGKSPKMICTSLNRGAPLSQ